MGVIPRYFTSSEKFSLPLKISGGFKPNKLLFLVKRTISVLSGLIDSECSLHHVSINIYMAMMMMMMMIQGVFQSSAFWYSSCIFVVY